ncbi:MAG: sugar transferase [Pseudomonadota bacterium]
MKISSNFYDAKRSVPQWKRPNGYLSGPKRALDLVLAALLLPIVAPLLLLLYVIVRLDGGPGFYGQTRVGQYGSRFKCWKLRTMVVNAEQALEDACARDPKVAAEWQAMQKLKDDPRITPIGELLRKTSLDELPQIWNVIRGEMSFLGPRPFMVEQQKLYTDAGGGDGYFLMRPGISGLWQTEGRSHTKFVDRIRYDNMYLAKVSFGYDMWLILRTVMVLLKRTGT